MTIKLSTLPGGNPPVDIKNLDALSDSAKELLDGRIYATAATLRASGPPHVTVVWCDRDSDFVYINSSKGRIKDRHLRERPEITLHLLNPENMYHWLSVEGTVVEMTSEDEPENAADVTKHINDLGEFYVKKRPYPNRIPGEVRVKYKIQPTRIVSFGPLG